MPRRPPRRGVRKDGRAATGPASSGPEFWHHLLQLVRDEAMASGETDFASIVDLAILHAEVLMRHGGAEPLTPQLHS